jgi:hypothetical protein
MADECADKIGPAVADRKVQAPHMQFQLSCYFLRCRRMYIECGGEKMVGGTFGDICGVSDIR